MSVKSILLVVLRLNSIFSLVLAGCSVYFINLEVKTKRFVLPDYFGVINHCFVYNYGLFLGQLSQRYCVISCLVFIFLTLFFHSQKELFQEPSLSRPFLLYICMYIETKMGQQMHKKHDWIMSRKSRKNVSK